MGGSANPFTAAGGRRRVTPSSSAYGSPIGPEPAAQQARRRMSGMQMTQAAGAVLSGGIFGGPEGFLGGAIGALGGVGGAFAGAAIGAQVGGIRRTLAEYADYAAQIARLQIALEGISGSQARTTVRWQQRQMQQAALMFRKK